MPILVSIVTVTKNCAPTIGRTLDSVKAVKSAEIEYIVIDGQSTDTTLSIIVQYDGLVDQLVSEPDTGIYNAMNKGAALAKGQYILFLNGDDHLLPDGFNKAIAILAEKTPEILSCASEAIDDNGNAEKPLISKPALLRFFNTIPHLSTFVQASLQRKYAFREQYRIAADYDLFLRLYLRKHRFVTSEVIAATHYRGGFSGDKERSAKEIRDIRKANLSFSMYHATNIIQTLNRFRKNILG